MSHKSMMSISVCLPHDNSIPDLDKLEKKTVKTIFQSLLTSAEPCAINMPL